MSSHTYLNKLEVNIKAYLDNLSRYALTPLRIWIGNIRMIKFIKIIDYDIQCSSFCILYDLKKTFKAL